MARAIRHLFPVLGFLLLVPGGCATAPREDPDSRLVVDAAMASSRDEHRPVMFAIYRVAIRNVSDEVLTIRRVEVEPVGGGAVRNAYTSARKRLEPGEVAEFRVTAEIADNVLGVGHSLAKVFVSFDSDAERVMASYLVEL